MKFLKIFLGLEFIMNITMSNAADSVEGEPAVWDGEAVMVAMVSSSLDLEMRLKSTLLVQARRLALHLPSRYIIKQQKWWQ